MSGKRSPRCHRRQKITRAPEHLREASIALGPCSSHELSVASLSPFRAPRWQNSNNRSGAERVKRMALCQGRVWSDCVEKLSVAPVRGR
jgi:hypothetical protein